MECRYRDRVLHVRIFKMITCSMCYYWMYPQGNVFNARTPARPSKDPGNYSTDKLPIFSPTSTPIPTPAPNPIPAPDIENNTVMQLLCNMLGDEEKCQRWRDCCSAALACCHQQQTDDNVLAQNLNSPFCPRTWDGYTCWKDTPANSRVSNKCPDYVHEYVTPGSSAFKDCTENGTWWRDPISTQQWTNYSTCVHIEAHRTITYVSIAFNLLSVLLLVPASLIFLSYRPLRLQHRIRLHLCLFASFLLTTIFNILWDVMVYHDQFIQHPDNALINRNTIGCRFLYFMSRYSNNTNYFCMFVEGFYLYRLLAATFEKPKNLVGYYIFGWVFPLIPTLVYAGIRGTMYNDRCWVSHAGTFEWILYAPNLACILGNLIFLFYIYMVLIGQLQSHPNEPSNYRRTLKATFVLVPLFGLQLLLIIYRPPTHSLYAFAYEIISKIIINSQGALVSLVFCFLNGEVHGFLCSSLSKMVVNSKLDCTQCSRGNCYCSPSCVPHSSRIAISVHGYLRSSLERLNASPVRRPERSCSMSTQFTMVSNKSSLPRNGHAGGTRMTLNSSYPPRTGSGQNYIPLDTIQKNMDTSLVDNRGHNSVV